MVSKFIQVPLALHRSMETIISNVVQSGMYLAAGLMSCPLPGGPTLTNELGARLRLPLGYLAQKLLPPEAVSWKGDASPMKISTNEAIRFLRKKNSRICHPSLQTSCSNHMMASERRQFSAISCMLESDVRSTRKRGPIAKEDRGGGSIGGRGSWSVTTLR